MTASFSYKFYKYFDEIVVVCSLVCQIWHDFLPNPVMAKKKKTILPVS